MANKALGSKNNKQKNTENAQLKVHTGKSGIGNLKTEEEEFQCF